MDGFLNFPHCQCVPFILFFFFFWGHTHTVTMSAECAVVKESEVIQFLYNHRWIECVLCAVAFEHTKLRLVFLRRQLWRGPTFWWICAARLILFKAANGSK
jgi:hypothetical protein